MFTFLSFIMFTSIFIVVGINMSNEFNYMEKNNEQCL